MPVTYVLKSRSGSALLSFDDINKALDTQRERRKKGIDLRLFKVTTIEEEVN